MQGLHGKRGHTCNEITNLYYGTHADNMGPDRVRDGTDNRGEKSAHAKLSNAQARIVKKLLKSNSLRQKEIAEIFQVSETAISDIKTGRTWVHLESKPANMLDCV
jgi:predicted XRE-type DNA-binding protein